MRDNYRQCGNRESKHWIQSPANIHPVVSHVRKSYRDERHELCIQFPDSSHFTFLARISVSPPIWRILSAASNASTHNPYDCASKYFPSKSNSITINISISSSKLWDIRVPGCVVILYAVLAGHFFHVMVGSLFPHVPSVPSDMFPVHFRSVRVLRTLRDYLRG